MGMASIQFTLAVYALATGLYLAYAATFQDRIGQWGHKAVHAAFLIHAVALAEWMGEMGPDGLSTLRGMLPLAAWTLAAGYLVVDWRFGVRVLGAFVTPVVSLALLVCVMSDPAADAASHPARGALLPVHIALALLGAASLALACGVAVLYLLLERQVKRKRFGNIFHRFPSLETLDRINFRCVTVGFPIYTVALLLGALWTSQAVEKGPPGWRVEWLLAVLAWVVFGVLLQARVMVGWRGRRAAILTITGFAAVVGVLAEYMLRRPGA